MKIGLVHDWLIQEGGAEKVFKEIYQLYNGDIHTLFHKNSTLFQGSDEQKIFSSWLNRLPKSDVYYRNLLPFFPLAMKSLDLSSYDLIISSSHCMAKNIQKREGQIHISYCHTPARYLWDLHESYCAQMPSLSGALLRLFTPYLQREDEKGSASVDEFIANSSFVKERILRCYGREAKVIYPPVDVDFFTPSLRKKGEYYMTCSRLISYKNIDLLLETFAEHPDKRLLIVGEGPERKNLEKKAPSNVQFLGWIEGEKLRSLFREAKAFLYAAIEDFGIILVEAIAAGAPVIALGYGGAREIVSSECGILFDEPSTNSLTWALEELEKEEKHFDPFLMHKKVERFSYERFRREFQEVVDSSLYSSRGKWN